MKHSIFLAIGLCLASLLGQAAELPLVKTTLQSMGLNTSVPQVRFMNGSSITRMDVPSFRIGKPTRYNGPVQVSFYLPAAGGSGDAKEEMILIGQTLLNPAWSETLLLWTSIGPNQYSITAVPNDLNALPVDHLRFINTTPGRVGLKIDGQESKILSPGEAFSFHTNATEVFYFLSMMDTGKGTTQKLSNLVEMRSGMRRTVFLTFDNATFTGGTPYGPKKFSFFVLTHREE